MKHIQVAALSVLCSIAILGVSSALAQAQPADSQSDTVRRALVIGNRDYAALPKLITPESDARLIATILETKGFQVDVVINGNGAAMKAAVGKLAEGLDENDIAVIAYAGHGLNMGSGTLLLPTDTASMPTQQVLSSGISERQLLLPLTNSNVGSILAIIDTDRKDPFEATEAAQSAGEDAAPRRGLTVLYSTGLGQAAVDFRPGESNSPFALALVEALKVPDQTLPGLFAAVHAAVATDQNQIAQFPSIRIDSVGNLKLFEPQPNPAAR